MVLAYDAPDQLRRLIDALDPLTVFLHVDARTPQATFDAMTHGLPERVHLVTRRVPTAWATFGAVRAELICYEQALAQSSATHFAWLSGSDYPLVSVDDLRSILTPLVGVSIADFRPLPLPNWGMSGGFGRLRYYHWAVHRHALRLPIPRRVPTGLTLAGGPVQKILARHHVEALLAAVARRPDVLRFWRRAWAPDETFVATIMSTPTLVPDWSDHHLHRLAWLIDWRAQPIQGPPFLTMDDLERIQEARRPSDGAFPRLFGRKFSSTTSADLLDAVDELRTQPLDLDLIRPTGPTTSV